MKKTPKTKEFNVVFCYSVKVIATDADQAEDLAWEQFANTPLNNADFAATVDESEPQ